MTDPLGTHNYTYFEDGKLRESPGELYGYDDLGQLKTSYGPKCYWYDYDNRGNITRKYYYSESGTGFDDFGVYEYTDSEWGDLLTKYNGTGITYGALGNPLNWRDGMSFTWENDRRLVSVTRNGSSAYYTYDAGGVRRTKTVGNTSLTYEYTDGKLVSQTDGTNVWWFYYDADGTRLAMEYNGEMYYYVYNIVGDVKGMYDSEGNIVAEYGYSGYGEHGYILNGAGQSVKDDPTHIANINPFRFKGYYFDAETEFYYLNTRYYDPYVCRFINADAFVYTGQGIIGNNMFAYCLNNPVNYEDSDGEMAAAVGALAWGAAAGGANAWNPVGWIILGATAIAAIGILVIPWDSVGQSISKGWNEVKSSARSASISRSISKSVSKAKTKIQNEKRQYDYWIAAYVEYGEGRGTYIPTTPLSYTRAISYVRGGGSVFADSRNNAYKLAKAVGGGIPEHNPAHGGLGYWRHYHAIRGGKRIGGHVFYVA